MNTEKKTSVEMFTEQVYVEDKEQFESQQRVMSSDKHRNRGIIPFAVLMDSPRMPQAQTFAKQRML